MEDLVDLSDAQAARLAARGDAEAFMVLVRRYRAPLIAHIHGRTRRRDEAEDMAQDAFCKAWQHLPRLREPAAFGGWLFRIAENAVVTAVRRRHWATLEANGSELPAASPSTDHSVDVHAAVASLEEPFRTAVTLRHFADLPTEEIARVLDVMPGTVRSRLSRAYALLRVKLGHLVEA